MTVYHDPQIRDRAQIGPFGVRLGQDLVAPFPMPVAPPAVLSQTPAPTSLELAMLGDMPPYLSGDPLVRAVIRSEASEFARIEAAAVAVQAAMFPAQANDVAIPDLGASTVARALSMWETLLGLPVAPPGVAVADRQAKVVAHIRKRRSGAGLDWEAVMTEGLGTTQWSYQEGPGDYQLTLTVPFSAGSYNAAQVAHLAAAVTAAHLQLTLSTGQGFLAGISPVGIQPVE